jgi:phosphoglycerate dehydrogenase-like enzyme
MNMRVLATKRHVPESSDPLVEQFYKPEAKREMMGLCDYIVATAPLTLETRHMISDAEFALMKPTAVVINVGRGAVVDEAALLHALGDKRSRSRAGCFRGGTAAARTSFLQVGERPAVSALRGPHR